MTVRMATLLAVEETLRRERLCDAEVHALRAMAWRNSCRAISNIAVGILLVVAAAWMINDMSKGPDDVQRTATTVGE